jgi:hypothetical protein
MRNTLITAIASASLTSCLLSQAGAQDWGMRFGLHDLYVDVEESHTRGVHVGAEITYETKSKILMHGSGEILFDNDKDELDSHHVPIWARSTYFAQRKAIDCGKNLSLLWYLDAAGRWNTTSSIEKTVKIMPGIRPEFSTENFRGGLKLVAGYYRFEIDDDVPKERGYSRDTLNNAVFGFSLGADAKVDLGKNISLYSLVQVWRDADQWLESRFHFEVRFDSGKLIKGSSIVLHAELNEWDLDPYANRPLEDPDYVPLLPWNDDRYLQIYIFIPFGRLN